MIHIDNYDDSNSNKDKDLQKYTAVQAVSASCQSPALSSSPSHLRMHRPQNWPLVESVGCRG